ncbi:hypothetical protein GCM10011588_32270 [Nocardia jinanensis]|uniref:Uncharacterized protein n=1 Tax=Nocardia jinanensis TaxID=382504 RepID=A0A917VSV2_9NOCA|nr:hypothetical protein GCM10011588_32270 [Nocardia jinanensis]
MHGWFGRRAEPSVMSFEPVTIGYSGGPRVLPPVRCRDIDRRYAVQTETGHRLKGQAVASTKKGDLCAP